MPTTKCLLLSIVGGGDYAKSTNRVVEKRSIPGGVLVVRFAASRVFVAEKSPTLAGSSRLQDVAGFELTSTVRLVARSVQVGQHFTSNRRAARRQGTAEIAGVVAAAKARPLPWQRRHVVAVVVAAGMSSRWRHRRLFGRTTYRTHRQGSLLLLLLLGGATRGGHAKGANRRR